MRYFEAPDPYEYPLPNSLFLAGGITDCPNWQADVVEILADRKCAVTLLNPRRANFSIQDPNAAYVQIRWEYHALKAAERILFWFPYETLCPIVLFELGVWLNTNKTLYIGTHPHYQRKQDVRIQTGLYRPDQVVYHDLAALVAEVAQDHEVYT